MKQAPAVNSYHETTAPNQEERVEELLERLEARSAALVPYGYWNQPRTQVRRSNLWALAAIFGCIWLSSLALIVTYFAYNGSSRFAERDPRTKSLLIPQLSDQVDQKNAESVDQLTKALADFSKRLNHTEVALQESNQDLQRLRMRAVSEVKDRQATQQPKALTVKINQPAATRFSAITTGNQTLLRPDANQNNASTSKSNPNRSTMQTAAGTTYQGVLVKPTDDAIPHRAVDGTIEYWLVKRGASSNRYKVQPIAITKDGVVIYCFEDGKKYTLTRKGEWRSAKW